MALPACAWVKDEHMVKFRVICPECWASVVTTQPEELMWELCPMCRHHVWDGYDARMADICKEGEHYEDKSCGHPGN